MNFLEFPSKGSLLSSVGLIIVSFVVSIILVWVGILSYFTFSSHEGYDGIGLALLLSYIFPIIAGLLAIPIWFLLKELDDYLNKDSKRKRRFLEVFIKITIMTATILAVLYFLFIQPR